MDFVSEINVYIIIILVNFVKAAGIDGLSVEHFVCAHTTISVH